MRLDDLAAHSQADPRPRYLSTVESFERAENQLPMGWGNADAIVDNPHDAFLFRLIHLHVDRRRYIRAGVFYGVTDEILEDLP